MASTSKLRVNVQAKRLTIVKRTSELVTLAIGFALMCFRRWPVLLRPASILLDLEVFSGSVRPMALVKRSYM
jgi:hypothetical protein